MSKYQDRGIIKWAPFDTLISYQEVLSAMKYERGKADKPILSDDQYEILDRTISEAMMRKQMIHVTYYENGYFKMMYGLLKAYDDIKKALVFREGFLIKINQIMDAYC